MNCGTLLFFLAACVGATQIITLGKIFNGVRPKADFFHCAMCTGFYVGALVGTIFMQIGFFERPMCVFNYLLVLFCCGCSSSAVSYFLITIVDDFGLKLKVTPNRKDNKNE